MVIIEKDGIAGKKCSHCREWYPLSEFPPDPSHGESQGGRHCRCYSCHRIIRKFGSSFGTRHNIDWNKILDSDSKPLSHDPTEEKVTSHGPLAGTKIFLGKIKLNYSNSDIMSSNPPRAAPDIEKLIKDIKENKEKPQQSIKKQNVEKKSSKENSYDRELNQSIEYAKKTAAQKQSERDFYRDLYD